MNHDDFPILSTKIHGKPLIYLDNAATTQKPTAVLRAIQNYYTESNANVHRGVHLLSEKATKLFEDARETMAQFINARSSREVIFTRGTTESLNLLAFSLGESVISAGDEIILTEMEHHSNIVPWQMMCERKAAKLKIVPINDKGELDLLAFEKLLSPKTKIVSSAYISNSLGTINPIKKMIQMTRKVGALFCVDAAQAAPHLKIDVQDLDCDFLALSGHKMYGPTGIGLLYGKEALLNKLPPYMGGGEMISSVTFEKTTYNSLPHKFEAGTPNIEGAVGLGAAAQYIQKIGLAKIAEHEAELLRFGTQLLKEIPEVQIIGTAEHKASILSFTLKGVHPHDIGSLLDQEGIAVRTGQHCTQPVMEHFGIPATTRASLGLYNTKGDLEALAKGIRKVLEVFR